MCHRIDTYQFTWPPPIYPSTHPPTTSLTIFDSKLLTVFCFLLAEATSCYVPLIPVMCQDVKSHAAMRATAPRVRCSPNGLVTTIINYQYIQLCSTCGLSASSEPGTYNWFGINYLINLNSQVLGKKSDVFHLKAHVKFGK